ncbi:dehydrogenase [Minicystis rosea]|nr:dehydrogenase [Minicystis rosea]
MSFASLDGILPWSVAAWVLLVGIYGVITSRHLVHLVVCVGVSQSSTYVLLLAIGYKHGGGPPIFLSTPPSASAVDPVVQALMLTDVVVEATVIALLLALAVRAHQRAGTVDPDVLDVMRG